jgi:hypothetical protein
MIGQGGSFETVVSLTQLDPEKVRALYDQSGAFFWSLSEIGLVDKVGKTAKRVVK